MKKQTYKIIEVRSFIDFESGRTITRRNVVDSGFTSIEEAKEAIANLKIEIGISDCGTFLIEQE